MDFKSTLKLGALVVGTGLAIFLCYLALQVIWPRSDALAAIIAGSSLREIGAGSSRMPCRGPNKKPYIYGYTLSVTHKSFETNASGAVCRDIINGGWVWRIDEPYGYMNSDRSPQSRGSDQEKQGYID